MLGELAQHWLADSWLARSVADALFRRRARGRLVELDRVDTAGCQARILRGLVHQARRTRFGRAHSFDRIRTPADFRRLVPLRTAAALWQEYGQLHFPHLENVTWPGPIPYLLPDTARHSGGLPFVAVSARLLESHRLAILTALALALGTQPRARLFSGRILFVGGAATPAALDGDGQAGSLEEIALNTLAAPWRPYFARTVVPAAGLGFSDERFRLLARETTRLPVTCILGTAGRLRSFFAQVRELTGRERIRDIWPGLTAVLRGSDLSGRDAALMESFPTLEVCFRPEGMVAVEDPRHGLLRLLVDHGIYFEFVPVETLDSTEPVRHTAAEVETGPTYEVALTSPAGVWACLSGLLVRFESRRPLLLRLEAPAAAVAEVTRPRTSAVQLSPPPPHPRTVDIPAVLPGMPFHSPS